MYGYHSRCLLHSSLKSADLWVQCFLAFSMLPLLLLFIPYIDLYVVCVCIYYCAIALNDYLHLLSQI
jgi:hypothetical protein